MKVQELRVGNLVINVDEYQKIRLVDLNIILTEEKCPFKPIPLTEEWFMKWGFKKDDEYWYRAIDDYKFCFKYRDWAKNWAFYQEFTDSPFPEDEGKKYPISFDIEYVHQLQNLWFSLLHKEIEENEE